MSKELSIDYEQFLKDYFDAKAEWESLDKESQQKIMDEEVDK